QHPFQAGGPRSHAGGTQGAGAWDCLGGGCCPKPSHGRPFWRPPATDRGTVALHANETAVGTIAQTYDGAAAAKPLPSAFPPLQRGARLKRAGRRVPAM